MLNSVNSNIYRMPPLASAGRQLFNLLDRDADGSVTSADLLQSTDENSSLVDDFMSRVDTNSDDSVTLLEFNAALSKLFQDMNDQLANDETKSVGPPPPPSMDSGERFSLLDADEDGYLTLAELEAGFVPDSEKILGKIDTDGDGKISSEESEAFEEQMRGGGPQGIPSAPPPPEEAGERFSSLDADEDGFLTLAELEAGSVPDAEMILSKIDTDGDGKISSEESEAFEEKMKANGPPSETDENDSSISSSMQQVLINRLIEMIAVQYSYAGQTTEAGSIEA